MSGKTLKKINRVLDEHGLLDENVERLVGAMSRLEESSNKQAEDIVDAIKEDIDKISDVAIKQDETIKKLTAMVGVIKALDIPSEVKIKNQLDPKELRVEKVEVKNLDEIKPKEEVSLKKPSWYKALSENKIFAPIVKQLKKISRVKIVDNNDPGKPIAVRLSDGKKFYKAVSRAVASGGGSIPFKTASGAVKAALVNSDGSLVFDEKETTGFNGGVVTVGTTAVEMTFTGTTQSISIMSDHDNSGAIYWGASNVASDGSNALGRLGAGQSVTIDLDDSSSAVYAVSDTASQTIYKASLT